MNISYEFNTKLKWLMVITLVIAVIAVVAVIVAIPIIVVAVCAVAVVFLYLFTSRPLFILRRLKQIAENLGHGDVNVNIPELSASNCEMRLMK